MTITVEDRAKKIITAETPGVLLRAELVEGERVFTVHGRAAGAEFKIDDGEGLDTLIELLHAVKAERAGQATFERKWLAEQADLQPHEEIIAVEEPTA